MLYQCALSSVSTPETVVQTLQTVYVFEKYTHHASLSGTLPPDSAGVIGHDTEGTTLYLSLIHI